MSDKTNWRKVVRKDGPYLTVWDIEGKTPLSATVERISEMNVTSFVCEEGSNMMFVHFKNGKKPLGMCSTNCAIMEMATGSPNIEDWIGKRVTLRTANCKGDDCIRLDIPAGKKVPKRYPRFNYTDKPKPSALAQPTEPALTTQQPAPADAGIDELL